MTHLENGSDNFIDGRDVGVANEVNVITKSISKCMGELEDANTSSIPESDRITLADSGTQRTDITDFNILKVLGSGSSGKVFLVQKHTRTDVRKLYAMKVLKKASIMCSENFIKYANSERRILEAVRDCPFIITLHYAFQTDAKLYLIMDYMNGGELFTHLHKRIVFEEHEVRIYIGEIILALEQLHKLGIIYRDLKLENILLDHEGHIVLTDFGLSKQFLPHERENNPRAYSYCGTLEYMAPEMAHRNNRGYNKAVDWWSVGILTYELLTGRTPFAMRRGIKFNRQKVVKKILMSKPSIPPHLNDDVRQFIIKLLAKNPQKRLGGGPLDAMELKKHDFFMKATTHFTWDDLEKRLITPPIVPIIAHELDTSNFATKFTNMKPVDSFGIIPSNCNEMFRGYSYRTPSIL